MKIQHKRHGSTLKDALETLRGAKLKHTKPRELLLRYLVENHGPFSASDLYAALKGKSVDRVTLYRTLAAFEQVKIVRRCDFGDGVARFEFIGRAGHHHHHVICSGCHKIEPLEDCHLAKLEKQVKGLGYSEVRHVLEFIGICRDCSRKSA